MQRGAPLNRFRFRSTKQKTSSFTSGANDQEQLLSIHTCKIEIAEVIQR